MVESAFINQHKTLPVRLGPRAARRARYTLTSCRGAVDR